MKHYSIKQSIHAGKAAASPRSAFLASLRRPASIAFQHIMSSILLGLSLMVLCRVSASGQAQGKSESVHSVDRGKEEAIVNPQSSIVNSVDGVTGFVHSQRLRSGVPLGGIGAGTFQLLTDGTVSHATIANNWNAPTGDAPGCFAAIWTQTDRKSMARVLALHSAYGLPTAPKLDYDGLYPQAQLMYPDPLLPVSVSLLAFSPLVPFDLKNASFPAAAFVLRLKNPGAAPVEVSVALSWESLLAGTDKTDGQAASIPSGQGFFGARLTGSDPDAEMTVMAYPQRAQTTLTTALWDANAAQPDWWDSFARAGTVPDAPPTATLKATRPAAVIAARLTLKPGETVELPFAVSWYQKHLRSPSGEDVGHYYEIAFQNAQDAAGQLLEDWRSLYGLTEEWQKRLTFSNLPRWQARRIINAAAPLTVNTIHTRDGRFAFLGTVGGGNSSPDKSPALNKTESGGVPLNAVEAERTETLAHETADALLLALFPQLAAQELAQFAVTQDSRGFVVPPAAADWSRRLGPAPPARKLLIARVDTLLALPPSQKNDGRLTPKNGGKPTSGKKSGGKKGDSSPRSPLPPEPDNQTTPAPPPFVPSPSPALDVQDATAAYVLQMTQFTLWTGDTDFLKQYYPSLRRALVALRDMDSSLLLPPSSFSLWLAAMRGGQKMAGMAGDAAFAQECEAAFTQGSARLEALCWNGEFYTQVGGPQASPGTNSSLKPTMICATDQLWGQWLAYQLDLGPLLPPAHLTRAAQSLQQRTDRPALSAFLPPWQVRADGSLPDALTAEACFLPASLLADAALHIWQDQPETGMALLRRLEDSRNNLLRSPWQYPAWLEGNRREEEKKRRKEEEETIHNPQSTIGNLEHPIPASLAAAADWNLLYALQGFALDMNSGQMTLAPNIPGTWRSFIAPVFAPTFWGRMEYRPTVHGGVTTFRLDRLIGFVSMPSAQVLRNRAELTLKTLRILGPPRRQDNTLPATFTAHVSVGTKPIGCRATLDKEGFISLTFDSPLALTAGDRLEVDVH